MENKIEIYKSLDNQIEISVSLDNDTVWLNRQQLSLLFDRDIKTIGKHINNVFKEGELSTKSTVAKFATFQTEGDREVTREIEHYNLDVIISVGYRVKSKRGTQFRIWATEKLREYIVKGFSIDSNRLKNLGGGNYWKELLDEIRDIRSSEKVLYRQVLDLYATAIDYDSQSKISLEFFKIVQNKLHFAAHGHTAAEVIYLRVDSDKPFVGLKNFKGKEPTKSEAMIAKNFLELKELKVLNNLVSAYFDLAEINALEEKPMTMANHIEELNNILKSAGRKVLENAGKVSNEKAKEKAILEYRKYKAKHLSEVEEDYLKSIKAIEKQVKKSKK